MSDAAKRKAAVLNKADAVSQVSECEAAGKLQSQEKVTRAEKS